MNNENLNENLDENLDENAADVLAERIKDILEDVKEGRLDEDSIAMIICLEDEIDNLECQIDLAESTIRLIKDKKAFATYDGDRNRPFDIDQFTIARKEDEKDN